MFLTDLLVGGVNSLMSVLEGDLDAAAEFEAGAAEAVASAPAMFDWSSMSVMLLRFLINVVVVGIVVHCFYYPKAKRRDYFFTFTLIAVSIFMLIYLMGGVKLKVGFALGLFAIFGIIKYRTEQVQIREMTYMFVVIAISVINGLANSLSYLELACTNLIFIVSLAVCENTHWVKHIPSKIIKYDNIKLISPEKEKDLIADLEKRTGLKIIRVEVGNIDFLKDSAIVKIYYEPVMDEFGTIENVNKVKMK